MLMSPYVEDIAKLVVEEKVPIVTTGAGLPTKYMKEWEKSHSFLIRFIILLTFLKESAIL